MTRILLLMNTDLFFIPNLDINLDLYAGVIRITL